MKIIQKLMKGTVCSPGETSGGLRASEAAGSHSLLCSHLR